MDEMSSVIYIYVLDTLAEWEIGYILQAVSLQNMMQEVKFTVKAVGRTKRAVKTSGGLTLIPDCSMEDLWNEEIRGEEITAILLPGADTWKADENKLMLDKISTYLEKGVLVGAICGATLALADLGILNNRYHTSNSLEYLSSFSENYEGKLFYKDELSVIDQNLITASSAGGLLWAKHILEYLGIYSSETTEAWYNYFLSGKPKYYMQMVDSLR
jgi:transcriptional regulator GlxA family with amidase domain